MALSTRRDNPAGNRIVRFLRDTRSEMRRVVWPSRQEWWRLTATVIIISAAVGFLLAAIDFVFNTLFQSLLRGV